MGRRKAPVWNSDRFEVLSQFSDGGPVKVKCRLCSWESVANANRMSEHVCKGSASASSSASAASSSSPSSSSGGQQPGLSFPEKSCESPSSPYGWPFLQLPNPPLIWLLVKASWLPLPSTVGRIIKNANAWGSPLLLLKATLSCSRFGGWTSVQRGITLTLRLKVCRKL